jgi:hypothetical protein
MVLKQCPTLGLLFFSSVVCAYSTENILKDSGVEYVELEDVQKYDRCEKYEQLVMKLIKLDFIHDSSENDRRELMKNVNDLHDFNICYEKSLVLMEKKDLKFGLENVLVGNKHNRHGKFWGWNLPSTKPAKNKVKVGGARRPGCWVRQRWTSENMDSSVWDEDNAQWVDFRSKQYGRNEDSDCECDDDLCCDCEPDRGSVCCRAWCDHMCDGDWDLDIERYCDRNQCDPMCGKFQHCCSNYCYW